MTLFLALVDGISSETGGKAIYVKCEDRMETKVMQIADFSFKPTLTMTSIEFNIGSEVSVIFSNFFDLEVTLTVTVRDDNTQTVRDGSVLPRHLKWRA